MMIAMMLAAALAATSPSQFTLARQLVASRFGDPATVKWRNVVDLGNGTVCGEAEGRVPQITGSKDGPWSGYRHFVVGVDGLQVRLPPFEDVTSNDVRYSKEACDAAFRNATEIPDWRGAAMCRGAKMINASAGEAKATEAWWLATCGLAEKLTHK